MTIFTDTLKPFVEHLSSVYFIYAGVILLVCGLPWIAIRRRIANPDLRRMFSSLIFALAFAPSMIVGDVGAFTVPAVWMFIYGLRGNFVPLPFISVGLIALLWGVIFVVRSFIAICCKQGKHHDG
jgi:hypothetical protein